MLLISTSTNCRKMDKRDEHIPFLLRPAAKDYLWGGTRLNDDFMFGIDVKPFAEAWVCSTHSDGCSVLDNGERLDTVLKEHPEYLGSHASVVANGEFPILIKLIDASKDLSVQVHPDDEYSIRYEGQLGKNEMWYVLDAKSDSTLVYGFNRDVEVQEVKRAIDENNVENLLNHVSVKKNDLFYIASGTVHAIGSGCLIAEVQENSNVTYRLYDYGRVDKNGKQRQLHIDKALKVANLNGSSAPRQPMRVLKYRNGCASELLCRCKYFQVERLLLNTEVHRELTSYKTEGNSFHALLCIDGCGSISSDSFMLNFFKGDCVFVPADSITMKLHGKAQLLDVSC